MSTELIEFIRYSSTGSILIPLVVGLVNYRNLVKMQKLLLFLVAAALLADIFALTLYKFKLISYNIVVYNFYTLIAFNLLWFIYKESIPKLRNLATLIIQIAINLFGVVNFIFIEKWNSFNSNLMVATSISFLFLAVFSFRQILQQIQYTRLEKSPIFWINTGVIIYYSGTLILFLLSNQINSISKSANNLHLAVWALNSVFNIILMSAYSFALWQKAAK